MRLNHVGKLDGRLARDVEGLARWWTSAQETARYEILKASIHDGYPPLATLRLAIILAEVEAGEVAEG